MNDSGAQELSYTTGADSIEVPINGIAVNMIPKDGGNSFHGVVFSDFTYAPWSASNLTPKLEATGLTNVSKVYHISDLNPGFGCCSGQTFGESRAAGRVPLATRPRSRLLPLAPPPCRLRGSCR